MDENLTEIINDWLISIHKLKLENSKKNDNFELENFKKDWTLVLKKIGSFMSDIYMRTATYYHNFQGRGTITLRYLKFEPIPTDITPCFKDIIIEKLKLFNTDLYEITFEDLIFVFDRHKRDFNYFKDDGKYDLILSVKFKIPFNT